MEVTFPRVVLSEFNTHRVFSRNSASSRAIPIEKRISAVEVDPFIPETFGKNQKGMQASEDLNDDDSERARHEWMSACVSSIAHARKLASLGVHKQLANRLIEPFCWQTVIVTSTEWSNFFALRCNPDAQPEIRKIAEMMKESYVRSTPRVLGFGQWHTPYVDDAEADQILKEEDLNGWSSADFGVVARVSAGRCARVSYLTHDGRRDWNADITLANRLQNSGHMSPFEHAARPMTDDDASEIALYALSECGSSPPVADPFTTYSGNFRGWLQLRKLLPNESDFSKIVKV